MNKILSNIAVEAKKLETGSDGGASKELVTLLAARSEILTPEIITQYLKSSKGSIVPAVFFILRADIIKPEELYKIFVPMFMEDREPIDPLHIRYLVGVLLDNEILSKDQARQFVNGLMEHSEIERIYQGNKLMNETSNFPSAFLDEPPEDNYILGSDLCSSGIEKTTIDYTVIKSPGLEEGQKAAVNRLYGGSNTFWDNIDSYLGEEW